MEVVLCVCGVGGGVVVVDVVCVVVVVGVVLCEVCLIKNAAY